MAVGVDIEDISRFKDKSEEFIKRIFTDLEQEYCYKFSKPESHFAVRFCAKEAVIKALTAYTFMKMIANGCPILHTQLYPHMIQTKYQ